MTLLHKTTPRITLFFYAIIIGLLCCCSVTNADSGTNETRRTCPYFHQRFTQAQSKETMTNCTHYHKESCCLPSEREHIFAGFPTLPGATSGDCRQQLNFLMCWVCSPYQKNWFVENRLVVCDTFCNRLYDKCSDALFSGKKIGDRFQNGTEFCQSLAFNVLKFEDAGSDDPSESECFNGAPSFSSIRISLRGMMSVVTVVLLSSLLW
eukprot:gb/GECH01014703.1/.p1 GENE.gb/GECH01014703.1/~~gb/GECH01014703.1/.p1  ORF type:complete len:208 (+),score=22.22 gb/GECH01014703.1/:1-624(+)